MDIKQGCLSGSPQAESPSFREAGLGLFDIGFRGWALPDQSDNGGAASAVPVI
ncbi:hypothetical protein [Paenibacillus stellifer]|uniref:hypothetical protein n=1 Tax=Paenibacillus stellifer TaxID=169760 RepID=UPI000B18E026|nr:hypothetical protein [Paenibacillus stellifer]